MQPTLYPNHKVKDRLFRMLFKDKKEFLELYNAMNGTNYSNPEDLIVTTLENAIYMGMKNDVSFLLYDELLVYEHQSTDNPNMPLRNLLYVSNIYSGLMKKTDLYKSTLQKIPEARFVVFYNGKKELPDAKELKLSDAYINKSDNVDLELKTHVLNINLGHNKELMEKCKTLHHYMILVGKIREYSEHMPYKEAIEQAVEECIREGVLADFLLKNKSEVLTVCIFEYDEQEHMDVVREEGLEEGLEKGRKEGLEKGREEAIEEMIVKLIKDGNLSERNIMEISGVDKEKLNEIKSKYIIQNIEDYK